MMATKEEKDTWEWDLNISSWKINLSFNLKARCSNMWIHDHMITALWRSTLVGNSEHVLVLQRIGLICIAFVFWNDEQKTDSIIKWYASLLQQT